MGEDGKASYGKGWTVVGSDEVYQGPVSVSALATPSHGLQSLLVTARSSESGWGKQVAVRLGVRDVALLLVEIAGVVPEALSLTACGARAGLVEGALFDAALAALMVHGRAPEGEDAGDAGGDVGVFGGGV